MSESLDLDLLAIGEELYDRGFSAHHASAYIAPSSPSQPIEPEKIGQLFHHGAENAEEEKQMMEDLRTAVIHLGFDNNSEATRFARTLNPRLHVLRESLNALERQVERETQRAQDRSNEISAKTNFGPGLPLTARLGISFTVEMFLMIIKRSDSDMVADVLKMLSRGLRVVTPLTLVDGSEFSPDLVSQLEPLLSFVSEQLDTDAGRHLASDVLFTAALGRGSVQQFVALATAFLGLPTAEFSIATGMDTLRGYSTTGIADFMSKKASAARRNKGLAASKEEKSVRTFAWDSTRLAHSDLDISEGNTLIVSPPSGEYYNVMGDELWKPSSGVHCFEVTLQRSTDQSVYVGIGAAPPGDELKTLTESCVKFAYCIETSSMSKIQPSSGGIYEEYGTAGSYSHGAVIKVTYDSETRQLSYAVDGKDLGVAFTCEAVDYRACVSVRSGSTVKLLGDLAGAAKKDTKMQEQEEIDLSYDSSLSDPWTEEETKTESDFATTTTNIRKSLSSFDKISGAEAAVAVLSELNRLAYPFRSDSKKSLAEVYLPLCVDVKPVVLRQLVNLLAKTMGAYFDPDPEVCSDELYPHYMTLMLLSLNLIEATLNQFVINKLSTKTFGMESKEVDDMRILIGKIMENQGAERKGPTHELSLAVRNPIQEAAAKVSAVGFEFFYCTVSQKAQYVANIVEKVNKQGLSYIESLRQSEMDIFKLIFSCLLSFDQASHLVAEITQNDFPVQFLKTLATAATNGTLAKLDDDSASNSIAKLSLMVLSNVQKHFIQSALNAMKRLKEGNSKSKQKKADTSLVDQFLDYTKFILSNAHEIVNKAWEKATQDPDSLRTVATTLKNSLVNQLARGLATSLLLASSPADRKFPTLSTKSALFLLHDVSEFLRSIGKLSIIPCEDTMWEQEMEKCIECPHPYVNGRLERKVEIPGAEKLTLTFDADSCRTASENDTVTLTNSQGNRVIAPSHTTNWPKNPIEVEGSTFTITLNASDAENAPQYAWGYRIVVSGTVKTTPMAWIKDFCLSLGYLVGSIACRLMLGDKLSQAEKDLKEAGEIRSTEQDEPLLNIFGGGLSDTKNVTVENAEGLQLDLPTPFHSDEKQRALELNFLKNVMDATSEPCKALFKKLNKAARDRVIVQPTLKKPGEKLKAFLVTALMLHTNCVSNAIDVVENDGTPTKGLVEVWQKACSAKSKLTSVKQRSDITVDKLLDAIEARVVLLLQLRPALTDDPHSPDFNRPASIRAFARADSQGNLSVESPSGEKKKLGRLWNKAKAATKMLTAKFAAAKKLRKMLFAQKSRAEQLKPESRPSFLVLRDMTNWILQLDATDPTDNSAIPKFRSGLEAQRQRALTRIIALRQIAQLTTRFAVEDPDVVAQILYHLGLAIRHVSNDKESEAERQAAFADEPIPALFALGGLISETLSVAFFDTAANVMARTDLSDGIRLQLIALTTSDLETTDLVHLQSIGLTKFIAPWFAFSGVDQETMQKVLRKTPEDVDLPYNLRFTAWTGFRLLAYVASQHKGDDAGFLRTLLSSVRQQLVILRQLWRQAEGAKEVEIKEVTEEKENKEEKETTEVDENAPKADEVQDGSHRWSCGMCTFINVPNRDTCEMCESARGTCQPAEEKKAPEPVPVVEKKQEDDATESGRRDRQKAPSSNDWATAAQGISFAEASTGHFNYLFDLVGMHGKFPHPDFVSKGELELYANQLLWLVLRCLSHLNDKIPTMMTSDSLWLTVLFDLLEESEDIGRVLIHRILSHLLPVVTPANPIFQHLPETITNSNKKLVGYLLDQVGDRCYPWRTIVSSDIDAIGSLESATEPNFLLRVLLASPYWSGLVNDALQEELSDGLTSIVRQLKTLGCSLSQSKQHDQKALDVIQRTFGAVSVLGGHIEPITAGSTVEYSDSDNAGTGTVIRVSQSEVVSKGKLTTWASPQSGNSCYQSLFVDIKAKEAKVIVRGFMIQKCTCTSSSLPFTVYACNGTHRGHEVDASHFRQVGSGNLTRAAPFTRVDLDEGVSIEPGETVGFLLHTTGDGMCYGANASSGQETASNSDFYLYAGHTNQNNSPFSQTDTPKHFYGSIIYETQSQMKDKDAKLDTFNIHMTDGEVISTNNLNNIKSLVHPSLQLDSIPNIDNLMDLLGNFLKEPMEDILKSADDPSISAKSRLAIRNILVQLRRRCVSVLIELLTQEEHMRTFIERGYGLVLSRILFAEVNDEDADDSLLISNNSTKFLQTRILDLSRAQLNLAPTPAEWEALAAKDAERKARRQSVAAGKPGAFVPPQDVKVASEFIGTFEAPRSSYPTVFPDQAFLVSPSGISLPGPFSKKDVSDMKLDAASLSDIMEDSLASKFFIQYIRANAPTVGLETNVLGVLMEKPDAKMQSLDAEMLNALKDKTADKQLKLMVKAAVSQEEQKKLKALYAQPDDKKESKSGDMGQYVQVYQQGECNVRDAPDLESNIVGKLKKGQKVTVYEEKKTDGQKFFRHSAGGWSAAASKTSKSPILIPVPFDKKAGLHEKLVTYISNLLQDYVAAFKSSSHAAAYTESVAQANNCSYLSLRNFATSGDSTGSAKASGSDIVFSKNALIMGSNKCSSVSFTTPNPSEGGVTVAFAFTSSQSSDSKGEEKKEDADSKDDPSKDCNLISISNGKTTTRVIMKGIQADADQSLPHEFSLETTKNGASSISDFKVKLATPDTYDFDLVGIQHASTGFYVAVNPTNNQVTCDEKSKPVGGQWVAAALDGGSKYVFRLSNKQTYLKYGDEKNVLKTTSTFSSSCIFEVVKQAEGHLIKLGDSGKFLGLNAFRQVYGAYPLDKASHFIFEVLRSRTVPVLTMTSKSGTVHPDPVVLDEQSDGKIAILNLRSNNYEQTGSHIYWIAQQEGDYVALKKSSGTEFFTPGSGASSSLTDDALLTLEGRASHDWNYIAISSNNETVQVFLNGSLVHSEAGVDPVEKNSNTVTISDDSSSFVGSIKDIAFWNSEVATKDLEETRVCGLAHLAVFNDLAGQYVDQVPVAESYEEGKVLEDKHIVSVREQLTPLDLLQMDDYSFSVVMDFKLPTLASDMTPLISLAGEEGVIYADRDGNIRISGEADLGAPGDAESDKEIESESEDEDEEKKKEKPSKQVGGVKTVESETPANGCYHGLFSDIKTKGAPVTFKSFTLKTCSCGTPDKVLNIWVYKENGEYKSGRSHEGDQAGWEQVATGPIDRAGKKVEIKTPFTVPPETTVGFYFQCTTDGIMYGGSNNTSSPSFENLDIRVSAGRMAKANSPFQNLDSDRHFHGEIEYEVHVEEEDEEVNLFSPLPNIFAAQTRVRKAKPEFAIEMDENQGGGVVRYTPGELVEIEAANSRNSCHRGLWMDIVAKDTPILITAFTATSCTCGSEEPRPMTIFTCEGKYSASRSVQNKFTKVGGGGISRNAPTKIELDDPVLLEAGERRGFFLHCQSDGLMYSSGSSDGQKYFEDDHMALHAGCRTTNVDWWNDSDSSAYQFMGKIEYQPMVPKGGAVVSKKSKKKKKKKRKIKCDVDLDPPAQWASPKPASGCYQGLFLDMKATDRSDLYVTGFKVKSCTCNSIDPRPINIYAMNEHESGAGHEQVAGDWHIVGTGAISRSELTWVHLDEPTVIEKGKTRGFFLHCTSDGMMYGGDSGGGNNLTAESTYFELRSGFTCHSNSAFADKSSAQHFHGEVEFCLPAPPKAAGEKITKYRPKVLADKWHRLIVNTTPDQMKVYLDGSYAARAAQVSILEEKKEEKKEEKEEKKVLPVSAPQQADSAHAYNGCYQGQYFDIKAKKHALTITSLTAKACTCGADDGREMTIYTRVGSGAGHEQNSSGWTEVAKQTITRNDCTIELKSPVRVEPGKVAGFFLHCSRDGMMYGGGASPGEVTLNGKHMNIVAGYTSHNNTPFADRSSSTHYSGIITYTYEGEDDDEEEDDAGLFVKGKSTEFDTGRNPSGCYHGLFFDLKMKQTVAIEGFQLKACTCGADNGRSIHAYWRPGTSVGKERSNGGWTKVGTGNINRSPSDFMLSDTVVLQKGQTYGWLLQCDADGMMYGGGGSVGESTAENSYFSLLVGNTSHNGTHFNDVSSSQHFSGKIYFAPGSTGAARDTTFRKFGLGAKLQVLDAGASLRNLQCRRYAMYLNDIKSYKYAATAGGSFNRLDTGFFDESESVPSVASLMTQTSFVEKGWSLLSLRKYKYLGTDALKYIETEEGQKEMTAALATAKLEQLADALSLLGHPIDDCIEALNESDNFDGAVTKLLYSKQDGKEEKESKSDSKSSDIATPPADFSEEKKRWVIEEPPSEHPWFSVTGGRDKGPGAKLAAASSTSYEEDRLEELSTIKSLPIDTVYKILNQHEDELTRVNAKTCLLNLLSKWKTFSSELEIPEGSDSFVALGSDNDNPFLPRMLRVILHEKEKANMALLKSTVVDTLNAELSNIDAAVNEQKELSPDDLRGLASISSQLVQEIVLHMLHLVNGSSNTPKSQADALDVSKFANLSLVSWILQIFVDFAKENIHGKFDKKPESGGPSAFSQMRKVLFSKPLLHLIVQVMCRTGGDERVTLCRMLIYIAKTFASSGKSVFSSELQDTMLAFMIENYIELGGSDRGDSYLPGSQPLTAFFQSLLELNVLIHRDSSREFAQDNEKWFAEVLKVDSLVRTLGRAKGDRKSQGPDRLPGGIMDQVLKVIEEEKTGGASANFHADWKTHLHNNTLVWKADDFAYTCLVCGSEKKEGGAFWDETDEVGICVDCKRARAATSVAGPLIGRFKQIWGRDANVRSGPGLSNPSVGVMICHGDVVDVYEEQKTSEGRWLRHSKGGWTVQNPVGSSDTILQELTGEEGNVSLSANEELRNEHKQFDVKAANPTTKPDDWTAASKRVDVTVAARNLTGLSGSDVDPVCLMWARDSNGHEYINMTEWCRHVSNPDWQHKFQIPVDAKLEGFRFAVVDKPEGKYQLTPGRVLGLVEVNLWDLKEDEVITYPLSHPDADRQSILATNESEIKIKASFLPDEKTDEGKEVKVKSPSQELYEAFTVFRESYVVDAELIDCVKKFSAKRNTDPLRLLAKNFNPDETVLKSYKWISEVSLEKLQKRFVMFKYFNLTIMKYLDMFDLSVADGISTLTDGVRCIKHLIFKSVKKSLWDRGLTATRNGQHDGNNNRPHFGANRYKSNALREQKRVDNKGKYSLFGQCMQFADKADYFRVDNGGRAFKCNFQGEYSEDAGGPYRECMSEFGQELMSNILPLLRLCPNGKASVGANRNCWIPNVSSTHPAHTRMFEFMGMLFGLAIRSGTMIEIDLAPVVWKLIVNEEISEADILGIDILGFKVLEAIKELESAGEVYKDSFEELLELKFEVIGTDMKTRPLCPGGRSKPVTWDNRHEYADLYLKYRLNEFNTQVEAIKRGLAKVVPSSVLGLFTWDEVQRMVAGTPQMDVDLLFNNTTYSGSLNADTPHIQMFWTIMRTKLNDEERSKFLRFVWGRSRLPLSSTEFTQKFQIHEHSASNGNSNVDNFLPASHTCFFTLDLPRYTNVDTMCEKLRYAFNNCISVDGDSALNSGAMDMNIAISDDEDEL